MEVGGVNMHLCAYALSKYVQNLFFLVVKENVAHQQSGQSWRLLPVMHSCL